MKEEDKEAYIKEYLARLKSNATVEETENGKLFSIIYNIVVAMGTKPSKVA